MENNSSMPRNTSSRTCGQCEFEFIELRRRVRAYVDIQGGLYRAVHRRPATASLAEIPTLRDSHVLGPFHADKQLAVQDKNKMKIAYKEHGEEELHKVNRKLIEALGLCLSPIFELP